MGERCVVSSQRGDIAEIHRSEWVEQVLHEAARQLPDRCCRDAYLAAFRLRRDGQSYREIARAQRVDVATAHRRVQRVTEILRVHLASDHEA